jgi:hypothetical protein
MQASVTCAATGTLHIKDPDRIKGSEGDEVFSERRGLSLFQNKVGAGWHASLEIAWNQQFNCHCHHLCAIPQMPAPLPREA